jgi:DNA polymerase III subunit gamma/tau
VPQQALYLKWRPLRFADVVGQEHVTRTLRNSLKTGRIRHAYLFSGPRGTGKTSLARLLAKAVNCLSEDAENRPCNECENCLAVNDGSFLDLVEIDAASHTGVDDVRDLRERITFAPNKGLYRVYIIDEVHRFSGNAFDALLKTLEEPPSHALFVLATTEIDKVPATIKSRCLPFEFRRVSLQEVVARLRMIAESESLNIETAALELIAREGTGSVRDSISLLDQIVADPEEAITLELTQRILGTASVRAVRGLIEALASRDIAVGLRVLNQAIDEGSDPRQFGQQVVEQLRNVLLTQTAGTGMVEASQEDITMFEQLAGQIDRAMLLRALRNFNDAIRDSASGWQPQLALELALVDSLQEPVQAAPVQPARGFMPPAQAEPAILSDTADASDDPAIATGPPVVPVESVPAKWKQAIDLIYSHRDKSEIANMLPNFMREARVYTVDGHRITMAVSNNFNLEKLSDSERVRWIERALFVVYGEQHTLKVRFIVTDKAPPPAKPNTRADTPSADEDVHEEVRVMRDVEPLIDELGGELQPIENVDVAEATTADAASEAQKPEVSMESQDAEQEAPDAEQEAPDAEQKAPDAKQKAQPEPKTEDKEPTSRYNNRLFP